MSFSGDQWGRPQQPPAPEQPTTGQRRGRGPLGCYLLVVGFCAVITVISFAVSRPGDPLFAWMFFSLTVGVAIVPILIRNIFHAARHRE